MRPNSLQQLLGIFLGFCLLLLICSMLSFRLQVKAQQNCPSVPPYASVWKPNSTVSVISAPAQSHTNFLMRFTNRPTMEGLC